MNMNDMNLKIRKRIIVYICETAGLKMTFEVETCCHINPLKAELNPICHFLALLGTHHILHVSRIRVKVMTLPLLEAIYFLWYCNMS